VTRDVKKFFGLMLKKNGCVLEQLHSPLVVAASPALPELRAIAQACVTKHHVHHYRGFAANQWKLFAAEPAPRVKPLLYVFRVLLTSIWLMRTGEIQADLPTLNQAKEGVREYGRSDPSPAPAGHPLPQEEGTRLYWCSSAADARGLKPVGQLPEEPPD
jgi:predicted nucleotidyltransferase